MKVLFVISELSVGGQERQMTELALGLTRRNYDVHVAVAYPGGDFEPVLKASGIDVRNLQPGAHFGPRTPLQRLTGFAQRWWRLMRLIQQERYDVVHGYGEPGNVYASLATPPRSSLLVWGWRGSTVLSNRIEAALLRLLSRRVALVICNSEAGQRQILRDGLRPRRIEVVENGIDTDRFTIDAQQRTEVRAELDIAPDEALIGIVANMHPWKGYTYLIEAFASVAQTFPVRLLAIGNDYHQTRRELQRTAEKRGIADRIIWHDAVSDVERYMNGMDLLVSSSLTEGFSNVIAEAMSCGVPCVVTNVGDSARIVADLGLTVPPADAVALASAIAQSIQSFPVDRHEIRRSIVDRFSVERLVTKSESTLAAQQK